MAATEPYPIAPDLASLALPIDSVAPHPRNPRQGDVGAICGLLLAYGQTVPIVVQRSTRFIVKGNHTWKAAKLLGATLLACSVMDLSDAEAAAYLAADNRASDLASYDEAALARLVRDCHEAGLGQQHTGYDGEDLDRLLRDTRQFPPELLPPPRPERQRDPGGEPFRAGLRQLALTLPADEYDDTVARLDRAMAVAGLPTHTAVILFLLAYWEVAQGDALGGGDDAEEAAD